MKLKTENQIWDPETAYRESRAGNLRLLIAILVIIAIGAVWISGILTHQKRTGEVALNASMTFARTFVVSLENSTVFRTSSCL